MANGMGSLYVGASGLQNAQHALNTTANNLANVGTEGYVRQQVLFADQNYTTFNTTAAISNQQAGLGVTIGDVVHTRDVFLDKYYRVSAGRQSFYQACADTTDEVQLFFQELEGETFQKALIGNEEEGKDGSFWAAIEELAKHPDLEVKQNLVIEKAALVVERSKALYASIHEYQDNLNQQVSDTISQINKLAKQIQELNNKVVAIESGGIETAMTYRDERDLVLDKLNSLANISYREDINGCVTVKLEGIEFIDECMVYPIGEHRDPMTGFITPYWKHLSDAAHDQYRDVFDYTTDISTELATDIGKLKALVLARGDRIADYRDVLGLSENAYNNSTEDHIATGMSVVLSTQASLDQMMHQVVTAINDVLCPNKELEEDVSINGIVLKKGTLVWDTEKTSYGSDMEPHELFERMGTPRYNKIVGIVDGVEKTYYVYNEEDPDDVDTLYTIHNLCMSEQMLKNGSLLASHRLNGEPDYKLGEQLARVFTEQTLTLSPNDKTACSVKSYYANMIGAIGIDGSVYSSVAKSLEDTVSSIETQRQVVIGVSSDEELTSMIKYQNAYNASSRFINVINEMLEHLITQLG